jgi:hypothetical protein
MFLVSKKYRTWIFALWIVWTASHASAQTSANLEKRVDALLRSMTLEEKISLLGGTETLNSSSLPRLGIPALRMSDGPVGVHDYGPTTAYTAGIALGASWDTDLARRVGESMGDDARARGVHFILGPGLNIYRAPMAGRNFDIWEKILTSLLESSFPWCPRLLCGRSGQRQLRVWDASVRPRRGRIRQWKKIAGRSGAEFSGRPVYSLGNLQRQTASQSCGSTTLTSPMALPSCSP